MNRTTTNIETYDVDDDDDGNVDRLLIEDDTDGDSTSFESEHKKRRSNNNDQLRIFKNIANDMKENQNRKVELLQQVMQPKTELELFFASICKTVEKFTPLDRAKVKAAISRIVGDMEIANIENTFNLNSLIPQGGSFTIESLPVIYDEKKQ